MGDFSNWEQDSLHYMFENPRQKQFLDTDQQPDSPQGIHFSVPGGRRIKIGDPYCDKVSDPNDQFIDPATYPGTDPLPCRISNRHSECTADCTGSDSPGVFQNSVHPWTLTDLVIYELLVRDFTTPHTFLSLIDTLNYLKNLGINAVELMPVMEFEGNISWGYNPDYSFAVDKYYGPKKHPKTVCGSSPFQRDCSHP